MKNMLSVAAVACLWLVFVVPANAAEGNIAAGKAKAGMCAGCHGTDGNGVASNPLWRSIFLQPQNETGRGRERGARQRG
jgi:cytochrome c553